MNYIEVTINKPLYGTFCYVAEKYIDMSKRTGVPLRIKTPKGEGIFTADQWLLGAKVMKKVFLRPDDPMVLYGNWVVKKPIINQLKLI